MSQSAFSAVLVGVTALLRWPSLLRGRGCGWRALASAASRSDLAARGFGFRRLPRWVRCFSLRLRCSRFWLPPLVVSTSLLLASAWLPGFRLHRLPRWVRRFSLRLGCSWFRLRCSWLRLPRIAALSSLLVAPTCLPGLRLPPLAALSSLLLASAWLLMVSVSAACRTEFAASRFDFAARGFGFRRLPR